MEFKSFSYLKILQGDNADMTYKMTWDDLDLSLLPINQMLNRYKGVNECPLWDIDGSLNAMKEYSFVEDEMCQFQVYAQKRGDNNSEINSHTRSMVCHLCNINIPASFIKNHMESSKHVNLLKLSNEVLSRTSKQLNETFFLERDSEIEKSYYCDICNIIIKDHLKDRHEKEKIHLGALKRDQLMKKLIEMYIEDLKENKNIVDKRVENEKVVKSNEVTKVYNNEPNDCNKIYKQALLTSTKDEPSKDNKIKNDSDSPQSYVNESGSNDTTNSKYNKLSKGQDETSTKDKSKIINYSLNNGQNQNVSNETVNINKIQNKAKKSMGQVGNKINQENTDQVTFATKEVVTNKSLDETGTTNKFNLVDFDDEHYRVTALNEDVVKVSKTNWHRILKYRFDNDTIECFDCSLCKKEREPIKMLKKHLGKKRHRKHLLTPVADRHCIIRLMSMTATQDEPFDYFCFLCNCYSMDEESHKSTEKHKQNLDQALLFPRNIEAKSITMNETNKTSNHFCELCRVNVPKNSKNIVLHNEGKLHKNNILKNMKTSCNKTTASTQIALSESKAAIISHLESSSTITVASKPKHGPAENDNLKHLPDKKQQNVVSETKQKENENSLNKAKESNSTIESKQAKKHLGDEKKPTKNTRGEIIPKQSEFEKKNAEEHIRESKQRENEDLSKEIKESTGAAAASVKSHNSFFKERRVLKETKPSEQLTDFVKMQKSENKQPENKETPKEVKNSCRPAAKSYLDQNDLVVMQIQRTEQNSDIPTTEINEKSENKQTDEGFPRKILEHSNEIREIVYKMNDSVLADSIVKDFQCLIDVTTFSGDVLRISKLNYHGLIVSKWIHCLICETEYEFVLVQAFLGQHITSEAHLTKLKIDITGDGLRKGRRNTSHCVVCNMSLPPASVWSHISREKHQELLAEALVDPNGRNTEKNISADESKAQDALRYSNMISNINKDVDYSSGDYISKLIRKSYRGNDISSYKLLQFLWSYVYMITPHDDGNLKLRMPYYHGIHITNDADSYSCLLCQRHGRKLSLKSITDHIESEYHVTKLRIPIGDRHVLRLVRHRLLHCALCNVNFDDHSVNEHVYTLEHRNVFGRDPEPRLTEQITPEPTPEPAPVPTPKPEDIFSSCAIS